MRTPPGGTVTFLFTDIEGSTRLVRAFKERWPEVRSAHRKIVRAAFEAHGGDEVDTQGDSFFYVFGRARDAALAAADAHRALDAHEWPEGGEVRIRIGMHTGEPVMSEEGYHGIGVHRAARIMAAGHGGQVLLSEATAAVLGDEEVAGIGLRDLGRHQLKDLDRPEHLYQLVAEGLASDFPRVRTAAAPRPMYRRPLVIGAAAGVLAAAVAIPVFAFAGGSGSRGALGGVQDNAIGVVGTGSRTISAEVPDVQSPQRVAAGAGAVWVTSAEGSLVRLDPSTHSVQQTIGVGNGPQGVAVNGNDVWVANSQDRTVSRVSAQTNQEVVHYPVGNTPTGVAVGGGKVWVTNADDGTISQLDATTGRPGRTIQVGSPVGGIAYGGGKLWVTDPVGNALVEVAPGSGVVTRISVGSGATAVAYRDGTVWVANNLDGTISRVDASAARVTGTYLVGSAPNGIAVTPGAVWVTDEVTGTLTRVDPVSGQPSHTSIGGRPEGVAALDGSLWVAVQAAGNAHRGGTLRVVSPGPGIDFIDPARSYFATTWSLLSLTSDGLVGFKRVGGTDGNTLVPDLAVSLPRPSADGKSYTFQLRKGIRFSNGKTLRASDVRYSMERLFKAVVPRPDFYEGIVGGPACKARPQRCDLSKGVLVDDAAGTVTFRLRAPDAEFLYKLALPFASVVPAGTPPGGPKDDRPVVGTGPYRISEYNRGHFLRLVRNPHFGVWSRAAQPDGNPDVIELRIGGTQDSQARAVEQGRADWVDDFPADQLLTARTQYPAQLHITPQASTLILALDNKRRPFSNVSARKALAYAFDRRRLISALGGSDLAAPTCGILPPSFPGYRPFCPYVAHPGDAGSGPDLVRARALVRASGTGGSPVTTLKIIKAPGPFGPIEDELNRTLRELGYRVSVLKTPDVSSFFKHLVGGAEPVDAAGSGWNADYPAPSNFMVALVGCGQQQYVCDRALDRRMQQLSALQIRDPERANAGWAALDREVAERALVIPLTTGKATDFVSKRVGNYQSHPVFGVLLDQLWVR
jgi:ABC-type transport system substrate-binding protein/class 3 adenylate cyclase